MTEDWKSRTRLLTGDSALERLYRSHVLVAGLGGVGAYAAEMICRAGIGAMTIVDGDAVVTSNRNRQLLALTTTEGKRKTDVMAQRLLDINPDISLRVIDEYMKDEKISLLLSEQYDYVVDAIDTLAPKVFLIYETLQNKMRLVSSMGAGGKLDPTQVQIADVAESYGCRFAFIVRKRLHRLGVRSGFKVVFSPEPVDKERIILTDGEQNKKSIVGTVSWMPAVFGNFCASVVVRDLLKVV